MRSMTSCYGRARHPDPRSLDHICIVANARYFTLLIGVDLDMQTLVPHDSRSFEIRMLGVMLRSLFRLSPSQSP
jgi:hypothetical protein